MTKIVPNVYVCDACTLREPTWRYDFPEGGMPVELFPGQPTEHPDHPGVALISLGWGVCAECHAIIAGEGSDHAKAHRLRDRAFMAPKLRDLGDAHRRVARALMFSHNVKVLGLIIRPGQPHKRGDHPLDGKMAIQDAEDQGKN